MLVSEDHAVAFLHGLGPLFPALSSSPCVVPLIRRKWDVQTGKRPNDAFRFFIETFAYSELTVT